MVVLDGTTIFWLIAIGMVVGAVAKLAMWNTTIGLVPNVVAGIMGSVVVGGVMVLFDLPGGFLFAMLGSVSILFMLNVFYQQREGKHLEIKDS